MIAAAICFANLRLGNGGAAEAPLMFTLIATLIVAAIATGPWLVLATGRIASRGGLLNALAGRRLLADVRTPGRVTAVFFAAGGVFAVVVVQAQSVSGLLHGARYGTDQATIMTGLGIALAAGVLAMIVASGSLVAGAIEQVLDGCRSMAVLVALSASPMFVVSVLRRQLLLTVLPPALLGADFGWFVMSRMMGPDLTSTMAAYGLAIGLAAAGTACVLTTVVATALVRPVVLEVCTPASLRTP